MRSAAPQQTGVALGSPGVHWRHGVCQELITLILLWTSVTTTADSGHNLIDLRHVNRGFKHVTYALSVADNANDK